MHTNGVDSVTNTPLGTLVRDWQPQAKYVVKKAGHGLMSQNVTRT